MSKVINELNALITRGARREIRQAVQPLGKSISAGKKELADLKRRLTLLEKENQRLAALLQQAPKPECEDKCAEPEAATATKANAKTRAKTKARSAPKAKAKAKDGISGKTISSLRKKFGMTQEAFAKLVGVSPGTVYLWERKSGALQLRSKAREALMAVREMGRREAKAKLAELAGNAD